MSSITPEFLKKKAREISYALNRVSFYIKREELRNRIERLSFEFLENVAVATEDAADKVSLIRTFKSISALDVLVRIGHTLYEIETVNANILLKELDVFNSAIKEFGNSAIANPFAIEHLNLESIFSMPPAVIEQGSSQSNSAIKDSLKEINSAKEATSAISTQIATIDKEKEIVAKAYSDGEESIKKSEQESFISKPVIKKIISENGAVSGGGNSAIRQNLIADRVRQVGRVSVKDMVSQFPGVSERTLRYDLQKLCDQGVIERVGNSGPGTSYIPKKN